MAKKVKKRNSLRIFFRNILAPRIEEIPKIKSRRKKLDEGEKAEILDLYDGSFASVRQLAQLFHCNKNSILYIVNPKYKAYFKEMGRKYYQANLKKSHERNKRYYLYRKNLKLKNK